MRSLRRTTIDNSRCFFVGGAAPTLTAGSDFFRYSLPPRFKMAQFTCVAMAYVQEGKPISVSDGDVHTQDVGPSSVASRQ